MPRRDPTPPDPLTVDALTAALAARGLRLVLGPRGPKLSGPSANATGPLVAAVAFHRDALCVSLCRKRMVPDPVVRAAPNAHTGHDRADYRAMLTTLERWYRHPSLAAAWYGRAHVLAVYRVALPGGEYEAWCADVVTVSDRLIELGHRLDGEGAA